MLRDACEHLERRGETQVLATRAAELASLRDRLADEKDGAKAERLQNEIHGLEVTQQCEIEREVGDPSAPNSVDNATG